jgi:hypothetical protein
MAKELALIPVHTGYGVSEPIGTYDPDGWAEAEHTNTWQDSGQSEALMLGVVPEIQALVEQQVALALDDFTQDMTLSYHQTGGQLQVLVQFGNAAARLGRVYDATRSMLQAIAQAEQNADADMLKALGAHLRTVGGNFRAPVEAVPRAGRAPVRDPAPVRRTPARTPVAPAAGRTKGQPSAAARAAARAQVRGDTRRAPPAAYDEAEEG